MLHLVLSVADASIIVHLQAVSHGSTHPRQIIGNALRFIGLDACQEPSQVVLDIESMAGGHVPRFMQ
jgi:hypothetical protein